MTQNPHCDPQIRTTARRKAGLGWKALTTAALLGASRLAAPARAEDPPPAAAKPAPELIRFISYNVQFLPGPGRIANKRKNLDYRAKRLGEEMAQRDVIALNETFDDKPREILLEQVRKAWGGEYHEFVSPKPPDGRFNSGLLILSRYPITETHHVAYTVYSDPKQYGVKADGFAAKGSLHARIAPDPAHPEAAFDVFTTHLEARADELRPAQYKELAAFMAQCSDPGRPAALMGDMNTHGNVEDIKNPDSDYNLMLKTYNGARPAAAPFVDLWPALHPGERGATSEQDTTDEGGRIDYIFVSNPARAPRSEPRLEPKSVSINFFQDPEVVALSDHSAVEAKIQWGAPFER